MTVSEVVILVIGWLFGLFTTPIANEIERRRERSSLVRALGTELKEVQRRMALLCYGIRNRNGELTIDQLRWTADIIETGDMIVEYQRMATNMRAIANNGAEQVAAMNARNAREKQLFSLVQDFRLVEAPFLTAHLHRLDLLDETLRYQLWFVEAQLRLYRELVEEGREYFRMTFDASVTGDNRTVVLGNLERTATRVADRARIIAEHIGALHARIAKI